MKMVTKEMEIPCLDFTADPQSMIQGSDGWKRLCKDVREACEGFGCFQVLYNEIPIELHQELFKVSKELFDLPDETKQKNTNARPFYGYIGKYHVVPLYESLGIEDATSLDSVQAFARVMWPDNVEGNPAFCQTVNTMSTKIYDLELIILKLIMESYGVEKYYESYVESNNTVFRVMRYKAPQSEDSVLGLAPHVDKSVLTILGQDSVEGLEILTKEDNWIQVVPLAGAFVVFVGEALKAWTNGRFHAVKHRVMMRGDKTRYSFALFSTPKQGTTIEIPKELIDADHPQRFRTFNYMDFLNYYYVNIHEEDKALEVYAGL